MRVLKILYYSITGIIITEPVFSLFGAAVEEDLKAC